MSAFESKADIQTDGLDVRRLTAFGQKQTFFYTQLSGVAEGTEKFTDLNAASMLALENKVVPRYSS